jgi:3-oxoacyl-[acyl-carrier protein] reductase
MRTVVVTGAAGAIGRALIEVLAEGPYRLGLIDVPGAPLEEVAAIARVETIAHESLLDSDAACAQAAAACGATIHGLVHLAGVYQPDPIWPARRVSGSGRSSTIWPMPTAW